MAPVGVPGAAANDIDQKPEGGSFAQKPKAGRTDVKVAPEKNLADLYTKCHNSTTRQVLKQEMATLASSIPSKRKAVCK